MEKMPLISVIVPIYNVAEQLKTMLIALKNQTYPNFEVWLIDDGSTDESAVICANWAENELNFHLLKQINQGVSVARNNGVTNAKGAYITFVDGDDAITPTYLEDLYRPFEQRDFGMTASEIQLVKVNQQTATQLKQPSGLLTVDQAVLSTINSDVHFGFSVAKLFHRKVIIENQLKFDPQISYGEDKLFVVAYLLAAQQAVFVVKQTDYHYLLRTDSATQANEADQTAYNANIETLVVASKKIEDLVVNERPVIQQSAQLNRLLATVVCVDTMAKKEQFGSAYDAYLTFVRENYRSVILKNKLGFKQRMAIKLTALNPKIMVRLKKIKTKWLH